MKKVISLICVLALLLTTSVVAFAADYNADVIAALQGSFSSGNYTYSLSTDSINQVTDFLAKHQLTQTQADKISATISKVKTDILKNGPTQNIMLKDMPNVEADILSLMADSDFKGSGSSQLYSSFPIVSADHSTITVGNSIFTNPILNVTNNSPSEPNNSSTSTSTPSSTTSSTTNTVVDATGATTVNVTTTADNAPEVSGNTVSFSVTVPSDVAAVASAAATADKHAAIQISAPTDMIVGQLNSGSVQSVDLSIKVPAQVANNSNANVNVALNLDQKILQAAKQTQKNVTISVVDSQTLIPVYSWTFKGADLAKSTEALKNVNMTLGTKIASADANVSNAIPTANKGLLLTFGNNGVLPAPATVKIFVVDQGFIGGQTLYLYYYNASTKQLEADDNSGFKVDNQGFASFKISHCSQYVLLSQKVAAISSLKLDTGKKLTVKAGKSYQFKVTASTKPTFTSGNNSAFKVTTNGSKGNDYFFNVTAVGKAGNSTGFYINNEKTPRTIGTIVK